MTPHEQRLIRSIEAGAANITAALIARLSKDQHFDA